MKKQVIYLGMAAVLASCSKQTTTDEVDGQPVDPNVSEPKPEDQPEPPKPEPPKPGPAGKYAIKEIMTKSFKADDNLKDLIIEGMATDEQKAQFVDYVENLAQFKPRKGDAASWKEKTDALISAAKGTDMAALKKAANCKACHSVHKIYPPKKK